MHLQEWLKGKQKIPNELPRALSTMWKTLIFLWNIKWTKVTLENSTKAEHRHSMWLVLGVWSEISSLSTT
jgi:hypothetical protein